MKKRLIGAYIALAAAMMSGLASCSSDSRKDVEAFKDVLDSDTFRENSRATGLYTDSKAEIDNDTLRLTFYTIEGLNYSRATPELMNFQKRGIINHFREALSTDELLRKGMEGLKAEGMVFCITFHDVKGGEASAFISPAEVLDGADAMPQSIAIKRAPVSEDGMIVKDSVPEK